MRAAGLHAVISANCFPMSLCYTSKGLGLKSRSEPPNETVVTRPVLENCWCQVTFQVNLGNLPKTGWLGLKKEGRFWEGYIDIYVPKFKKGLEIRWPNRRKDGQTDGWESLFYIGAVAFWSCVWLHAVNASLCHIWTVVSTSNSTMNSTEGEQRKDGGWISLRRSASCS